MAQEIERKFLVTNDTYKQSAVSHQHKVLRQNRLVKYTKNGKNVYYELSDDHVRDIIEKARQHIEE